MTSPSDNHDTVPRKRINPFHLSLPKPVTQLEPPWASQSSDPSQPRGLFGTGFGEQVDRPTPAEKPRAGDASRPALPPGPSGCCCGCCICMCLARASANQFWQNGSTSSPSAARETARMSCCFCTAQPPGRDANVHEAPRCALALSSVRVWPATLHGLQSLIT